MLALLITGGLRGAASASMAEEISWENSSNCDCQSWFSGLDGGAELTLLKPYHSMGIHGVEGTDLSFDWKSAPRVWLGYTAPNGLGIRARYWQFDQAISAPSIVAGRTETVAFDTSVLDLELTSRVWTIHDWDFLLSGGLRYVAFIENSHTIIDATGGLGEEHEFNFSGFGPTVSAYVYRSVFGNFGPFATMRGSVLMGDENEISTQIANDTELDNIRSIWELQLGAEWRRTLARGGDLIVRIAYEVQYWNSFSGEEYFDGGESVGFGGLAFAVEVTL